jgi:hypothetical protein
MQDVDFLFSCLVLSAAGPFCLLYPAPVLACAAILRAAAPTKVTLLFSFLLA